MAMFARNKPPAHAPNTTPTTAQRTHWRFQISHAMIGTNSSAFETFENVSSPRITAAATSLPGPKSHRVPRGARETSSTSLYNQQKYAKKPSEKLNSSGVIQTKYTGTIEAITNAPDSAAASVAFMRACKNR